MYPVIPGGLILVTKWGHWRFRGRMTPSRSEQAAPLAAGHPATTSETDAGMYPVTRGGLILVTKMW
jgi:hypothetical protein